MSSGASALSDSRVLEAFTDAYNDQFRKMMNVGQQSMQSAPPSASSSCGMCRQLGGPSPSMMMQAGSGAVPSDVASVLFVETSGGAPAKKSGKRFFWTVVVIVALLGLLLLISSFICKSRGGGPKYYASMPSVESAMAGGGGGRGNSGGGGVVTIADPSDVMRPGAAKALVMYYADWCGHCKEMKPVFEKLAASNTGAEFCKCEHSILEKSGKAAELGIQGYPTVVAFAKGNKQGQVVGNVGAEKLAAFIREVIQQ